MLLCCVTAVTVTLCFFGPRKRKRVSVGELRSVNNTNKIDVKGSITYDSNDDVLGHVDTVYRKDINDTFPLYRSTVQVKASSEIEIPTPKEPGAEYTDRQSLMPEFSDLYESYQSHLNKNE